MTDVECCSTCLHLKPGDAGATSRVCREYCQMGEWFPFKPEEFRCEGYKHKCPP
jgi:hypothetical protein